MVDNLPAKILVLGSQGNLGSQIIQELQTSMCGQVVAWTRGDCDVMDFNALETGLRRVYPSVVINTIAYNNVDACELNLEEQYKAIKLNIQLVECLARVCQEINSKLIHFSTNYVFSGEQPSYTEFDPTSPINFYGMTKQMGEEAVLTRLKTGLQGSIVRISNLFGPKGTSVSSKPSFFDSITKASESFDSLNVIVDEKSCYTYSKDVARAVVNAIDDEKFLGIYHFANSEPVTWYEAAQIYFEKLNRPILIRPIESKFYTREAKRPQTAVLQSTRTTPMRSFKLALNEYIQEFS